MHLVIRAQSLRHESVSQSIVAEFDERGGTIGRSDSNTMTLPDPERHVSRLQAEISCAAGAYALRNVGNANPIIVNGRPLGPGEAVTLRHQDQLTIGGYELRVELREQAGKAPSRVVDARTVIGASAREGKTDPPRQAAAARASSDPFAGLLNTPAKAGAADPFADLLGAPPSPPPPPRAASAPAAPARATSAPKAAPPPRLPDDFDPFAELSAPPPPPSPFDTPLQAVLGPSAAGPGIDAVFGLSNNARPGQADPLAAFLSSGDAADAPSINDPFAFLGGVGAPPSNDVGAADADHTPDLQAAYTPPPIRRPAPAQQPAPPPQSIDTTHDDNALWDAFCDGAQLSLPSRPRLTPELMRLIGATLREAVDGTLQLSAMRTVVKQELHVPVTTIRAKGNNPLKFAPDATAALTQLLQPPMRGFLPAPEAMQDAMTDLLGHTAGTIEGTRAAMQGMLRRFEPAQLEAQLAAGGMLDKLVPGNRRARLWELYVQHHGRISEAAREDFAELFGKAFVKAYEEHADRVAAARRARR
jgi:FHA domain-containing protein